ncbi:MAG TPA: hypothetical protein VFQ07_06845 [Candidatus Polarisedimenticolia bacterium]|nr:hypothetical protein [Candidatus Polarisedimenticolia bacterium]
MTEALLGAGLCLGAALVWLVATHLRERPWFERPDFARWRGFDALLLLVRWGMFAWGLLLLASGAPWAAALAVGLFLAALLWRIVARSAARKRRAMRKALAELRLRHPGEPERELLVRLVLSTHPRWGEELVRQMVIDFPGVDEISVVVARMEQGYRGFR